MNSELIEKRNMAKQFIDAMERLQEEDAKKLDELMSSTISVGQNIKEKLLAMREDFGDDLFDKIANGGSLMPVCDRWTAEKINEKMSEMMNKVVSMLREKGFEKISEDHVAAFIEFGVSNMNR